MKIKYILWNLECWFKESKTIDYVEEYLINSRYKILYKTGSKLWRLRRR